MNGIKKLLKFIDEIVEYFPETKGHYTSISSMNISTYYKSLARLKKQGLVKKAKRNNRPYYSVTINGKKLLRNIATKPAPLPNGLLCILTFDIPESMKRKRRVLCNFLKHKGFIRTQKSVFMSNNQPDNHLSQLLRDNNLTNFVSCYIGRKKIL